MKRLADREIESTQLARLRRLQASHPNITQDELARRAKVPYYIVDHFLQSHAFRNQGALSELERRVVAEALKPENQHPYAGSRVRQTYWLKLNTICDNLRYAPNDANPLHVRRILEKQASSMLDRIAENVFEKAYTQEAIDVWRADMPELHHIYYAHVARAAGTLPKTAEYMLDKRFHMPPPNIISEIAKTYRAQNMTLQITAGLVRGIINGQFRNNAQPYDTIKFARHIDSIGIAEPLKVAEGLVICLRHNKYIT